jgi:hypothetical protein
MLFTDYHIRSLTEKFAKIASLIPSPSSPRHPIAVHARQQRRRSWELQDCSLCKRRDNWVAPHGTSSMENASSAPMLLERKNPALTGVPTFIFRCFGDWDNLRLYPTSEARHGADLKIIFGASADICRSPDSNDECRMIAIMRKAWATFAHDPDNVLIHMMRSPCYVPDGA